MVSILERRRIEAEIIKPIYEALCLEIGRDKAQQILHDVVKAKAVEFGRELAEHPRSLKRFAQLLPLWMKDDALEIEVLQESDAEFNYNVHRCRFAEMYHEMGLGEIGHLLSCNRDGSFCQGYDDRLHLTRTQTIMQGASHCDFRYRWNESSATEKDTES